MEIEDYSLSHRLLYTIHRFSSFSNTYKPENILVDRPNDQMCRWSSENNNPPQFLTLKLSKPAIVKSITFGKFEKSHVCNLRKFKICGGMSEDGMIELLDSGLKNDSTAEKFDLRHTLQSKSFPCHYIKIIPLQSWGPSFNFSIWYVELQGTDDAKFVESCLEWYNTYRQREALRLCLKHIRDLNYMDVFESLQKRSRIELEHPLVTKLHNCLVIEGDFQASELLVRQAANEGYFDAYLKSQPYMPDWEAIAPPDTSDPDSLPGMRGGHQMVVDVVSETIYLFGGWDGVQDLSDFWSYHVLSREWTLISRQTELDGGPGPRSCHKMVLDSTSQRIFVLGRYVDCASRTKDSLKSDFYVYDITRNAWQLISEDTATVGGPSLVFDHQMVVDSEQETLYVFGGRILNYVAPSIEDRALLEPQYSGLYSYHIPTNSWTLLREDVRAALTPDLGIKSRIGHSMLFFPATRTLYVLAGQRGKDTLSGEMFAYHIDDDYIDYLFDTQRAGSSQMPVMGLTHRATIDVDDGEVFVFSGLNKEQHDKAKVDECAGGNSLWVYKIAQNQWHCIYQTDANWVLNRNDLPANKQSFFQMKKLQDSFRDAQPCPRYAHQLVYDHIHKVHYLFGGNPGKQSSPRLRLDDFWRLELHRPCNDDVVHDCLWHIRRARYEELVSEDPVRALQYLQDDIAAVVRHDVESERQEFQKLASILFEQTSRRTDKEIFQRRSQLFSTLIHFLPESMTPPRGSLLDLVRV